jgi:hypothetical protein
MGPDDPVLTRLEAKRLSIHDLKLKLAVAKQMEVDRDIANTVYTRGVSTAGQGSTTNSVGNMETLPIVHATDGCHGLPSRMKTK